VTKYMPCDHYILGQRSNCTHAYYHGKSFVKSLDIFLTWLAMMCC